jgi:hypothetical protein
MPVDGNAPGWPGSAPGFAPGPGLFAGDPGLAPEIIVAFLATDRGSATVAATAAAPTPAPATAALIGVDDTI